MKYIKTLGIKVIKTMSETTLAMIGIEMVGVTELNWLGILSVSLTSGIITILFNLKDLKVED